MRFEVVTGNALDVVSDVLVVKYAQARFGVDATVSAVLIRHGLCAEADISPAVGEHRLVETRGHIAAKRVLYVGVERLYGFGYAEMARFAEHALRALAKEGVQPERLATTVHGANYGLDAGEALEHLVAGIRAGAADGAWPSSVVFVEVEERRASLLRDTLAKLRPEVHEPVPGSLGVPASPEAPERHEKEHIFVAMPYSAAFEDIYNFGIYAPVRDCGFVCENVGDAAFTGDILHRIRERIATARLMIADLTEGRPNVYLEVGFAWGRNIPVVLLAHEGEEIHFDVRQHRCIRYRNATHLAETLREFLQRLEPLG